MYGILKLQIFVTTQWRIQDFLGRHQPQGGEGGANLLFGQKLYENEDNWTGGYASIISPCRSANARCPNYSHVMVASYNNGPQQQPLRRAGSH